MKREIKIGDWVNSYSKGIYRVEKIFDIFYEESSPLIPKGKKIGDPQNKIVLSKRFLNSKFKKSFSYDRCDESLITHLTKKDLKELDKVVKEKPELISELNKYKIPTLNTINNFDLQIDNENDLRKVNELIEFTVKGRSYLEIQNEMERLDIIRLKPKYFGNYKVQMFNYDFEIINKRFVWKDVKLKEN
ncbi:hypothetical protein [Algibacter lectus]|uniref:Uncharacterized protein n=1 Tax=Algibacter lectus TaxID=221126 RepID=A0A4R8MAX8_9FLAO|nr:hypothetical protein [Algibacter lectus]MWW25724.1 hypothetical protein [Algibacter lectus]TDY61005.1 hypothetical protein DFQ06_3014 [Algibacter lectus]